MPAAFPVLIGGALFEQSVRIASAIVLDLTDVNRARGSIAESNTSFRQSAKRYQASFGQRTLSGGTDPTQSAHVGL